MSYIKKKRAHWTRFFYTPLPFAIPDKHHEPDRDLSISSLGNGWDYKGFSPECIMQKAVMWVALSGTLKRQKYGDNPLSLVLQNTGFIALPVTVFLGLAFVVQLLALGQPDLQLDHAAAVEIKPQRHNRIALP